MSTNRNPKPLADICFAEADRVVPGPKILIECCQVPVAVCKAPQKTAGLGDNISATGL